MADDSYEVLLDAALESFSQPMFVFSASSSGAGSRHTSCLFANSALRELLGVDQDESLEIESIFHENTDLSTLLAGGEFQVQLALSRQSIEPTLVNVSVVALNAELYLAKISLVLDREVDTHVQRLQTLGILAGSIAHDVNNVLTGILGHVSYLRLTLPQTGAHVESISAIEDGAKKSALMTQQILSYSRSDENEAASPIDLCALAHSTCRLLRGAFSRGHTFEVFTPDRPLTVAAVESHLTQIIINLVVNARDAVGMGGYIALTLTEIDAYDLLVANPKESCSLSGRYLKLCVQDDGHGISEEIKSRVFDPYFSTKRGEGRQSKGTGLGLATVEAVVKSAGGVIGLSSVMGEGTEVSVYLPLVEDEFGDSPGAQRAETPAGLVCGTERVLVVDDEGPVRSVIALTLERSGYEVVAAGGGAEALEMFSQANGTFDLVVLDMIMPHVSGEEVFFQLKEINPNIRVLIASAYASEAAVNRILEHGGRGYIQKPFSMEELTQKVRECLDE